MVTQVKAAPRLGRGLSGLISNSVKAAQEEGVYKRQVLSEQEDAQAGSARQTRLVGGAVGIRVDDISANPYQPRRDFKESDLAELADSISQQGIIQPLIVVKSQDPSINSPYVLIAGERRLRAGRMAGLQEVPCIVRQATKQQMLEWALIENIQRSDLNPIERAQAYREYMDRFSLTHAQAAERLGQSRASVSNHLRILELSDDVQRLLLEELLTFGHAKVLAGLTGELERQVVLAKRVVKDNLSVRALENLLEAEQKANKPAKGENLRKQIKPPYIVDVEEQLTQVVGTRVQVRPGRSKNTGKIVVEYYNLDDFDRISASLGLKLES